MFEKVVVGATDSESAARAFARALSLTRSFGGTLHVVSTVPAKSKDTSAQYLPEEFRYTSLGAGATDRLLWDLERQAAEAHVDVATHAVLAEPAEAITRVAEREGADLIVLGTGSDHGARHLSEVPKAVMDRVGCAVLVV